MVPTTKFSSIGKGSLDTTDPKLLGSEGGKQLPETGRLALRLSEA